MCPDLDPLLDAPGVRVLGLASMPRWRWKSGRISARQADGITKVLGGPRDVGPDAVRVLAQHHPASATGAATHVGRRRFLAALAEARVELVLAGHTHVPRVAWLDLATEGGSWRVMEEVPAPRRAPDCGAQSARGCCSA